MSDVTGLKVVRPVKIAVIFGTRPEAIKLAPVILAMQRAEHVTSLVVNTGQHREMSKQALSCFDLEADVDLEVMKPGQTLGQLTATLFSRVDVLLERERPSWVVVQGDTTSAMVAATCAFYRHIAIGHVEAGLRTFQIDAPFPEEMNRTFIGQVSTVHFAPTGWARDNLLRAAVAPERILVTGNTVVDAINLLRPRIAGKALSEVLGPTAVGALNGKRLVLVTCHRRESMGSGIAGICEAVRCLIEEFLDVAVVFPVHPNPNVMGSVHELLGNVARIHLVEPLSYLDLMIVIEHATVIMSDSGGLQEEAPSFNKPILILREVTERPEVVEVGAGRLVGTNPDVILPAIRELLTNAGVYGRMANAGNPFGNGQAAEQIVNKLLAPLT